VSDPKIHAAIFFMPPADCIDRRAWLKAPERLFAALPWVAETACGVVVSYDDLETVPVIDVPCDCGAVDHFVIKWEPRSS
jgi:hypothetical protein